MLTEQFGDTQIEDLAVPFQCVAASIERAAEHWFDSGPLVDAVLASAAVPGLLPPVAHRRRALPRRRPGQLHPGRARGRARRADHLRAAGRPDRAPLVAPTRPWEVAMVAFEIARRHRFARRHGQPARQR